MGNDRTAAAAGAAEAQGRKAARARSGGLTGIVFVLKSGIPWEMLPQEMGCGSGMTCWRRLRDWQEAGVWERLHRVLLDRLGEADQIDWERACLDSASIPAKRGAKDRPESDGSRQTGHEAPRCFGPRRHPARGTSHRRQRPRLDGLRGADRRHSADQAPRAGSRASAPRSCTPTRPTTSPAAAGRSPAGASRSGSPGRASTPASGWAATGGWSSGRWPG